MAGSRKRVQLLILPSTGARGAGQRTSWAQSLGLLVLVPLVVGGLLVLTALNDVVIWNNRGEQVRVGCYYILLSFVLANALQRQWKLVCGWILVAGAIWVPTQWMSTWPRVIAAALGGAGVALLVREFLVRRRRYLEEKQH
jgi:hypothetical protein